MRRPFGLIIVAISALSACSTGAFELDGSVMANDDAQLADAGTMDGARGGPIGPDGMAGGDDPDGGGAPDQSVDDDPPDVVRLVGRATTADCFSSPPAEDVTRLVDGDVDTKFLAFSNSAWAVFDAGAPYVLSRYALVSANDAAARDPVR